MSLLLPVTAIAVPIHFAWNAGIPANPSGTTYELEANGVNVQGITTENQIIDLPVQNGDAINAQVRAVAPTGYECGDPLGPCPPSDWETYSGIYNTQVTAITPEVQSAPYKNAYIPESTQTMAITRTGSVSTITTGNTNNTGSASITVPSDATLAIVVLSGWYNLTNYFSNGSITLNGVSFNITLARIDSDATNFYGLIGYLVNPSIGTQTLAWDWSGTSSPNDPPIIKVVYYNGIDTSSPIRSSYGGQNSGTSFSTTSLTAQTGDLIFSVAPLFTYSGHKTVTWTNATEFDTGATGQSDISLAENSTVTGNTTVSFTVAYTDGGIGAFVLKPATVASYSLPPSILNKSFAQLLGR